MYKVTITKKGGTPFTVEVEYSDLLWLTTSLREPTRNIFFFRRGLATEAMFKDELDSILFRGQDLREPLFALFYG